MVLYHMVDVCILLIQADSISASKICWRTNTGPPVRRLLSRVMLRR